MFSHPTRAWLYSMVAAASLALASCSTDERPDRSQMTAVQYFQQTQANTMTPDGQILTSTAQEVGPNVIQYQTTGGGTYQARYASQGKSFRFFDVRRVEDAGEIVSTPVAD